jgi:hypothetical protein
MWVFILTKCSPFTVTASEMKTINYEVISRCERAREAIGRARILLLYVENEV